MQDHTRLILTQTPSCQGCAATMCGLGNSPSGLNVGHFSAVTGNVNKRGFKRVIFVLYGLPLLALCGLVAVADQLGSGSFLPLLQLLGISLGLAMVCLLISREGSHLLQALDVAHRFEHTP